MSVATSGSGVSSTDAGTGAEPVFDASFGTDTETEGAPLVAFGWFGKHPAFGDFVVRGVDEALSAGMQDWLDGALHVWRASAGDGWRDLFDAAPVVRFWIGARILGAGRSGVLVPSRDKVGRRYPMIVLTAGQVAPPPLEPGQDLHDALCAVVQTLRNDPAATATGDGDAPRTDDILWATNISADAEALLIDIAAEDLIRASQTRSYWWTMPAPGRPARVISVTGLPDGTILGWLMAGDGATEVGAESVTATAALDEPAEAGIDASPGTGPETGSDFETDFDTETGGDRHAL